VKRGGTGARGAGPGSSPPPGLCGTCLHARRVGNRSGSLFFLCGRSRAEPRFPRYPALPVLECEGYERGPDDPWLEFTEGPGGSA